MPIAMIKEYFSVSGDYIFRLCDKELQATNGTHSFSAIATDTLVLEYLKNEKENTESSVQGGADNADLTLTFWQLRGKIKLSRVSVNLKPLDSVIPMIPWVSAVLSQMADINHKLAALQKRISRQDQLLDEMTVAKQENQNELLRRVYTMINAEVKQEPE